MANMFLIKTWSGPEKVSTEAVFCSQSRTFSHDSARYLIQNKLISSTRASNLTDIAYLFYLPFCLVFVSSDRLHQKVTPLFLRKNQEFIWGQDLKLSFKELNIYYSQFTTGQKEMGIHSFASKPPVHLDTLVLELWDRHLLPWRPADKEVSGSDEGRSFKEIQEQVEKMEKSPTVNIDPTKLKLDEIQSVTFKRKVRKKKGSWYQIPKKLCSKDD